MKRIAFATLLSLLAAGAGAEPVKCVDASGKVRYIDSTMIGTATCQVVKDATNVVTPQAAPEPRVAPTPSRESRESQGARPPQPRSQQPPPSPAAAQAAAQLAEAEQRLAVARNKLAEQEAMRLGGERNFARVQERLQPFQETVERAQQEVEQARRNLP